MKLPLYVVELSAFELPKIDHALKLDDLCKEAVQLLIVRLKAPHAYMYITATEVASCTAAHLGLSCGFIFQA